MADEVTTRALAALNAFSSSSSDEEDVIERVQLRDRANPLQAVNKDFQPTLTTGVVDDNKSSGRTECPVKDKNSIQRYNATPPSATTYNSPISQAAKNKMEQIFQNRVRHNLDSSDNTFPAEVGLAELITETELAELIIQHNITLEQLKKWFHARRLIFNQNKSRKNDQERYNATPPSATTYTIPISQAAKNKMEQIFQNHIRHNLGSSDDIFPTEVGLAELITEAELAELIIQHNITLEQLKKWLHARRLIFNQNKSRKNNQVHKPNHSDISHIPIAHTEVANKRQNNDGPNKSPNHSPHNTKSTRTDKRKRKNIASSIMPNIEKPNNRTRINIFQHNISKESLSRRVKFEKAEDVVIPHKLDSMYHDMTMYASVPFDSRTMKNLHRAKEFNESLGMQYDEELPILNQKYILRKHRDKRVDELEEKLLKEIEDELLAMSSPL